MNVRASSPFFTMINDFCRFGVTDACITMEVDILSWREHFGYWGVVMFAEDVTMNVYLGTTPEQIIDRMNNVLSVCLYEG